MHGRTGCQKSVSKEPGWMLSNKTFEIIQEKENTRTFFSINETLGCIFLLSRTLHVWNPQTLISHRGPAGRPSCQY